MSDTARTYDPLHDASLDTGDWTSDVDLAVTLAQQALGKHAAANIHDHNAMLKAATSLDFVLRDLLAALGKEGRA